jgi:hypothetical protein
MHFYIMEKNILDSDGQQYLQYQQNVQSQVLAWTTHKMWRNELADGMSLIFVIYVVFLSGSEYVQVLFRLFTYVLPLKIQIIKRIPSTNSFRHILCVVRFK